jgi:hypothetical protein
MFYFKLAEIRTRANTGAKRAEPSFCARILRHSTCRRKIASYQRYTRVLALNSLLVFYFKLVEIPPPG